MPIQFACGQCATPIRVPDGSSGKSVRCPGCSTISIIPDSSVIDLTSAALDDPLLGSSSLGSSPFGATPSGSQNQPNISPPAGSFGQYQSGFNRGQSASGKIGFSGILSRSWNIFSNNWGACAGIGILMLCMLFAAFVCLFFSALASVFTAGLLMHVGLPESIAQLSMFVFLLFFFSVYLIVYSGIEAGMFKLMLKMARGKSFEVIKDMSSGWPYTWKLLGLNLINMALSMGWQTICKAPGMLADNEGTVLIGTIVFRCTFPMITLLFMPAKFMIVDRKKRFFPAINDSVLMMQGNMLVAFSAFLLVYIAGTILMVVTCGVGSIVVLPFWLILLSVIYLSASGQMVTARQARGQPDGFS